MNNEATIKAGINFPEQYYLLRKQEGRICTDEDLERLPFASPSPSLDAEWQVRKISARKLFHYLQSKKRMLRILEAGCGNGWLAHYLSGIKGSEVTGIELNSYELEQAKRVFKKNNLSFTGGSYPGALANQQFDIIVFAASIQYFNPLPGIISSSINLLEHGGELHFIDSHFYSEPDLLHARQRSREYFTSIGFPGMIPFYHHHRLDDLLEAGAIRMSNTNIIDRFLYKNSFPWYYIIKQ